MERAGHALRPVHHSAVDTLKTLCRKFASPRSITWTADGCAISLKDTPVHVQNEEGRKITLTGFRLSAPSVEKTTHEGDQLSFATHVARVSEGTPESHETRTLIDLDTPGALAMRSSDLGVYKGQGACTEQSEFLTYLRCFHAGMAWKPGTAATTLLVHDHPTLSRVQELVESWESSC